MLSNTIGAVACYIAHLDVPFTDSFDVNVVVTCCSNTYEFKIRTISKKIFINNKLINDNDVSFFAS